MNDLDTIYQEPVDTLATYDTRVSPVKGFTDWHFQDESYFAGSDCYHPERGVSRHGVMGDPLPYLMSRDDGVSLLLLVTFLVGLTSLSLSRNVLVRQLSNFFYVPRRIAEMTSTTLETRSQYVLVLFTVTNLALIAYLAYSHTAAGRALLLPPIVVIALAAVFIAASFLLRWLLYLSVNWVFFEKKKNEQWQRSWLFLSICEGVLLFPAIVLHIYALLPLSMLLNFSLFIVIVVKLLAFYKCKTIFFSGIGSVLQNILYFCTLEIVPLLLLCGIVVAQNSDLDSYIRI